MYRNVGQYKPDAGETPKRKHTESVLIWLRCFDTKKILVENTLYQWCSNNAQLCCSVPFGTILEILPATVVSM
jgi:hypothetical protein